MTQFGMVGITMRGLGCATLLRPNDDGGPFLIEMGLSEQNRIREALGFNRAPFLFLGSEIKLRLTAEPAVETVIVYVISDQYADQLGHELAMRVRAAAAHLRRRSNQVFAPFGLSTDQYVLMTMLAQQRKATQQELVGLCFSDTATIGAMVSLLETKGLVKRTPHRRDRRALVVRLTRSGQRLSMKMRAGSAAVRADMMALFSERELATLMEFLSRLAGAMRPVSSRSSSKASGRLKRRPSNPKRKTIAKHINQSVAFGNQ